MEPQIYSFEPKLYRLINRKIGYDPINMELIDAPGYYDLLKNGPIYRKFILILKSIDVLNSTGFVPEVFLERYLYLTLLCKQTNKKLEDVTVSDIYNSKVGFELFSKNVSLFALFGFPAYGSLFVCKWENNNGLKYICYKNNKRVLVSFNNMVFYSPELVTILTKYSDIDFLYKKCTDIDLAYILDQRTDGRHKCKYDDIHKIIGLEISKKFVNYSKSIDSKSFHYQLLNYFNMDLVDIDILPNELNIVIKYKIIGEYVDNVKIASGKDFIERHYYRYFENFSKFSPYKVKCINFFTL